MAEQNKQQERADAQPAQQPRAQQGRPCPKDCTRCSFQQHAFCAARMSFQMFEVMNSVIHRLDIQSQHIADIERRLASGEAEFSSPLPMDGNLFGDAGQQGRDHAQEEDGAENRSSEK